MVRDEGRTIKGIAAIKAWRSETGEKYHHTVEPLSFTERDGKTVVTAKVSGNFPGSPVKLDHVFELHGDRIVCSRSTEVFGATAAASQVKTRGQRPLKPVAARVDLFGLESALCGL
jgi:hypothetical protein